jgi:hypothetical protein
MRFSAAIHGLTLLAVLTGSGVVLYASGVHFNLPGIDRGYSPSQPLAFSHRLHAGTLDMRCLYCHSAADESRHAGLPAASVCMNCHRFVHAARPPAGSAEPADPARVAPELRKLYDAVGFDPETGQYDPEGGQRPIAWIKVHDLPDFVSFDHSRHVGAGVACQRCHGPIESMDRVTQVSDLTMGWCVNCHRDVNANRIVGLEGRTPSTDCAACHY